MKLLFDQNLSPRLVTQLADIFPDSTHVHLVNLDCTTAEVEALLRGNESTIREMVESDLSGLLALY